MNEKERAVAAAVAAGEAANAAWSAAVKAEHVAYCNMGSGGDQMMRMEQALAMDALKDARRAQLAACAQLAAAQALPDVAEETAAK